MKQHQNKRVVILTSVIGYGIYFPSLLIRNGLRKAGMFNAIYTIEHYFTTEKLARFEASRVAFKKDYRIAKMAAKMPIENKTLLSDKKIEELFREWDAIGASRFLCFSGLWLPVLHKYKESKHVNIDCCRIDAGISPTWSGEQASSLAINKTYGFFDLQQEKINYTLGIPGFKPAPFAERPKAILAHGGGWGLGNYIEHMASLDHTDYKKNIMIHTSGEYDQTMKNTCYYMNDPSWDPLNDRSDYHTTFPKLGRFRDGEINYQACEEHHGALGIINNSKAIISKPGGMTLLDTLLTETPLVYLDPMGPNEQGNRRICDSLQIGLSFESWKAQNFSEEVLAKCVARIQAVKKNLPDFLSAYIENESLI